MTAIFRVEFRPTFPKTLAEKKAIAAQAVDELTLQWFDKGLPGPEMFYLLVHRPGQYARNTGHGTHMADEAAARAQETDLVAVSVTLTDVLEGAEDFAVLQIRRTGPQ